MCGLVASLTQPLDQALRLIRYRGSRQKIMEPLGFTRMPIVGFANCYDQPVYLEGWTIAFVGELLDFRELHPSMECDVELVAQTWVKEGPRGFAKHDGFWSIVAYNQYDGSLHLLCDYLAIELANDSSYVLITWSVGTVSSSVVSNRNGY